MPESDKDNSRASTKSNKKGERVGIKNSKGKRPMDLLIFGFLALAAVSGGFLSVFSYLGYWQNKETWAVWAFYCLIIFTVTAGFLTWQKRIWEQAVAPPRLEQHRPVLTVVGASLKKLSDGRGFVEVFVKNSGQAVAKNATVHTTLWGRSIEEDTDQGCPEPKQGPIETMQSVGLFGVDAVRKSGSGVVLTKDQIANIEQQKTRLYVYLVTKYHGATDKYVLEYYARYDPVTDGFSDCATHNEGN